MSHVDEQHAYEIGIEAYTYLYPLVLMDATRRQAVNVEAGKAFGRGPTNTFTHVPAFPPAEFRDIVRPNFDTLYSLAWLDLTKEPMVVAAPDTQGRFYMLPMLDMWTDVFACPGKRTTGTGAGHLARAALLAGQASRRCPAHRRADTARLDHRAHPDQWTQGLRGGPSRAGGALVGLGANLPEDAVYPLNIGDADGKPLTGAHQYVLHFAQHEIPPARAFWSVTLYDEHGFPSANDLKRNAIGDRDALKFNADGSLDLYIQHASPGGEKESNWLPAPTGDFNLLMRVYSPKSEVTDGRWAPPAVKKVR
jgi:hypothetical protein